MTLPLAESTPSSNSARRSAAELTAAPIVVDGALDPRTCRALIEDADSDADSDRWLSTTAEITRPSNRPQCSPPRRIAEPLWPCRLVGADDRPRFAVVDDPLLALRLFYRLAKALPPTREGFELAGLKPLLRCLRFRHGEGTEAHCDPARETSDGQRSQLSVLVFLNDGFGGGAVEFPSHSRIIEARVGRAIVFPHAAMHIDHVVERGRKFVLEAEVFYASDWAPYCR